MIFMMTVFVMSSIEIVICIHIFGKKDNLLIISEYQFIKLITVLVTMKYDFK